MLVTIFHNVSTDLEGRFVNFFGYKPGHALVPVATYRVDDGDTAQALNNAYHVFNVGDDPEHGTPDPRAIEYRRRKNRSLSVGDVVKVGDTWHACASVGWDPIDAPEFICAHACAHGTTALSEKPLPN